MNSLNKTFWDNLQEKYPEGVREFKTFVDKIEHLSWSTFPDFVISMQEGVVKEFFREKHCVFIILQSNSDSCFYWTLYKGNRHESVSGDYEGYHSAFIAAVEEGFKIINKTK